MSNDKQRSRSLCLQLWLEHGPALEDVKLVLDYVVTCCCDFGTESTLQSAIPSDTDLRSALPWGQHIGGDGTSVDTLDAQPPWWGVAPLLRSALRRAVLIPGINHITHNISGMIADKLKDYKPWFLPRLKAIAYVLSHSSCNDRFRRTCLQAPEVRSIWPAVNAGIQRLLNGGGDPSWKLHMPSMACGVL